MSPVRTKKLLDRFFNVARIYADGMFARRLVPGPVVGPLGVPLVREERAVFGVIANSFHERVESGGRWLASGYTSVDHIGCGPCLEIFLMRAKQIWAEQM
jgi:hypothetical protein